MEYIIKDINGRLAGASPIVITVSGPSGGGKSTTAHHVADALRVPVAFLHTDDYYIGKTRMRTEMPAGEKLNFDHPSAMDLARLAADIAALKNGKTVQVPQYDMFTSEPLPKQQVIWPAPVIIIEGIAANLPVIKDVADISVCVSAPLETRMAGYFARQRPQRPRRTGRATPL